MSLKNKIVCITGASSGIGKACAENLASKGMHLILIARRQEALQKLSKELQTLHGIKTLVLCLDIQNKESVSHAVKELPDVWKKVDILINNAGLALSSSLIQEGSVENWDIMLNTNIHGLLYITHAILPLMLMHNSGHIVNIGSVAGHECYPGGNIYCATKHAVRAISKSLRLDLLGKAIRVTEIDPGAVHTEFSEVRWKDKKRAEAFYQGFTPLLADDIADAVSYCITRPPHVNISEIVIYPRDQASPNHLYRL